MTSLNLKDRKGILDLPPEVRLVIYGNLLASGDRSIFSISTLARNEGLPTTFYVHTGYQNSNFKAPQYSSATDLVQNLRIMIDMRGVYGSRHWPCKCGLIGYFGGSKITRESCEIILDTILSFCSQEKPSHDLVFQALGTLTGFKNLESEDGQLPISGGGDLPS